MMFEHGAPLVEGGGIMRSSYRLQWYPTSSKVRGLRPRSLRIQRATPQNPRLRIISQCGEDAKDESPGGARGVNAAGQHLESDSLGLQRADEFDHVGQRPANAVEFPDHERIAGAQSIKRPSKTRTVNDGAAASILKEAFAPRACQRIPLEG